MIDSRLLRKLLILSGVLGAVSAGLCVLFGQASFGGGLLLGVALGAIPVASWTWILSKGLGTPGTRALAVALTVLKLALYPAALYLLVTRSGVSGVAVFAGVTAVVAVVAIGSLAGAGRPAKEAA